ncbi:2-amino-4-hydroxy-6-hydroxymethyldihydropteridine diphosphokinase [Zooshikella harenae]|uniref:2-amino-4-hydroxy-6-hydroxymethyldihydropteridine pyrophosphokinase n=1 Tax=Zooshikella harenae TaxID=2827238 RepID=A0ABS5Z632_9GAMM|nr:2-amino-4-hydroxy-6-hydroxymethyldihydropteridine diphosphokinase [Zooshikella harenae]MBU2709454.1 2-amino-4-hydroxy-6-hydroxymethyldihydropteridine diphosphokinase [Zooshikella harenae]
MISSYIALGSNLDEPLTHIIAGLQGLHQLPDTTIEAVSGLYSTPPLGPEGQQNYLNAVAQINTTHPPLALLDALQSIEQQQGRKRLVRWGPRTLDLDILLYGNQVINHERLVVPHAEMNNRSFVLLPLADIAKDLVLPSGTTVRQLATNIDKTGITLLPTNLITLMKTAQEQ